MRWTGFSKYLDRMMDAPSFGPVFGSQIYPSTGSCVGHRVTFGRLDQTILLARIMQYHGRAYIDHVFKISSVGFKGILNSSQPDPSGNLTLSVPSGSMEDVIRTICNCLRSANGTYIE